MLTKLQALATPRDYWTYKIQDMTLLNLAATDA